MVPVWLESIYTKNAGTSIWATSGHADGPGDAAFYQITLVLSGNVSNVTSNICTQLFWNLSFHSDFSAMLTMATRKERKSPCWSPRGTMVQEAAFEASVCLDWASLTVPKYRRDPFKVPASLQQTHSNRVTGSNFQRFAKITDTNHGKC